MVWLIQEDTDVAEVRPLVKDAIIAEAVFAHNMDLPGQNEKDLARKFASLYNFGHQRSVWPLFLDEVFVITETVLIITKIAVFEDVPLESGVDVIEIRENCSELLVEILEDYV